jgi:antitoxin (DNA-binding transcriptional repressor) of toxin-antitoxin stability system
MPFLCRLLREVRSGGTVLVTDRGQVITQLAPPPRPTGEAGLADPARRGLLTRARGRSYDYSRLTRVMKFGTGADLLGQDYGPT